MEQLILNDNIISTSIPSNNYDPNVLLMKYNELDNILQQKEIIIKNLSSQLETQKKQINEMSQIINNMNIKNPKTNINNFNNKNIINQNNNNKIDISQNLPFIYKHVIIIGVDGGGNFKNKCNTPNIENIFSKGATTNYCRATFPTKSAENWGSMLTGVRPAIHKIDNFAAKVYKYNNKDFPTFFKLVRNEHPKAEFGAFCNWSHVYRGIIEQDVNVTKETDSDDDLTVKIVNYIKQKKPELLFIQFDSCDHTGHSKGYSSEKYLRALEIVDTYIGEIHKSIIDAGIIDDTLLMIISDHGGLEDDHGGKRYSEKYVFFGAIGKTINKNDDIDMECRDLAAIVTYALGVNGNKNWESFIPQNFFTNYMNPPARVTCKNPVLFNLKVSLIDYINMNKLVVGLLFNNNFDDLKNNKIDVIGKINFVNGKYKKFINISKNNYISIPNIKFGQKNFSICFWMNIYGSSKDGDGAIFSNKDWNSGRNLGFIYAHYKKNKFKFNVGNGNGCRDDFVYEDNDIFEDWNHIIFNINRETNEIKHYINFELKSYDKLSSDLEKVSFDTDYPFNIGQDGTGKYEDPIYAYFGDFLIFNDCLEENEIFNLKEFYSTGRELCFM